MTEYKSDRTVFKTYHTKDGTNNYLYWKSQLFEERLRAVNYLNGVAYIFPVNGPPKLDRTYLKI